MTDALIYPMKLIPVTKDILWGGTRLKRFFGKSSGSDRIAESWELTVRDDGMSVISNGAYAGMSLSDYMKRFYSDGRFPLLIKFIDSEDDLSVQVHPHDGYAGLRDGESGKCEVWYVVYAERGAELLYGLKDGTDEKALRRAIDSGNITDTINRVPVKSGDVFFIPPGQIHALTGGITVAEIQENSNTTYRLYDYGRIGTDGKKRELHLREALDVIKFRSPSEINALRFEGGGRGALPCGCAVVLCDTRYFRVSLMKLDAPKTLTPPQKGFYSLLFTEGSGTVSAGGFTESCKAGDSFFIPPSDSSVVIGGSCSVIISEP